MKVTIGLAQVGEDVFVVAARDEQEVRAALRDTLPAGVQMQLTIGTVKLGRVYKNLNQEVLIHSH